MMVRMRRRRDTGCGCSSGTDWSTPVEIRRQSVSSCDARGVRASLAVGIPHPPFAQRQADVLVERAGQLAPEARRQRVVLAEVGEHADHHLAEPVAASRRRRCAPHRAAAAGRARCRPPRSRPAPAAPRHRRQSSSRASAASAPGMIGLELERLAGSTPRRPARPAGRPRTAAARAGTSRRIARGTAPVNSSTSRPSRNAFTAGMPCTPVARRRCAGSRRRPS